MIALSDRLIEWARWCRLTYGLGPAFPGCGSAERIYRSPQADCWEPTYERLEVLKRRLDTPVEWRAYEVEVAVRGLPKPAPKVLRIEWVICWPRLANESREEFEERKRRKANLPAWYFQRIRAMGERELAQVFEGTRIPFSRPKGVTFPVETRADS